MKKALLLFGIVTAMFIGAKSFAACPCADPCPAQCPIVTPCQPACPVVTPCCPAAPVAQNCDCGCNSCGNGCRKKCTWWKIFEDKCCCDKCNNQCEGGCTAKRCHWWAFWTDRCVVQAPKCKCGCDKCCD